MSTRVYTLIHCRVGYTEVFRLVLELKKDLFLLDDSLSRSIHHYAQKIDNNMIEFSSGLAQLLLISS